MNKDIIAALTWLVLVAWILVTILVLVFVLFGAVQSAISSFSRLVLSNLI
jgi:uncharacterized integral membrane protein